MADLYDVEDALARAAAAALYRGDQLLAGVHVRVFRGWPVTSDLEKDMAAGRAIVSAFARPGTGRLTNRFRPAWRELPFQPPGIVASVTGDTATFSGSSPVLIDVGVRAGGAPYVVYLLAGSTAEDAAAALAAAVSGATASGPVLRVPGCTDLLARMATRGTAIREVRRQSQTVALIVWAPTPQARDAVARTVDLALASVDRLPLPDGSVARIQYAGSATLDEPSKATVWRRDLAYACKYPTVERRDAPRVLFSRLEVRERTGGTLLHHSTV